MNSSNLTNLITSNEKTRFCGQASQKLQRLFSSLLRNGQESFAAFYVYSVCNHCQKRDVKQNLSQPNYSYNQRCLKTGRENLKVVFVCA